MWLFNTSICMQCNRSNHAQYVCLRNKAKILCCPPVIILAEPATTPPPCGADWEPENMSMSIHTNTLRAK